MSKQPKTSNADRFSQALKSSEMSGADLARVLDLENEQNITNWKNRGVPARMLGRVATALGVRREWLEDGTEPMREDEAETTYRPKEPAALYVLEPLEPWDSKTPLDDDEVELRLYKEVELASGQGKTAVQEITGPKLRFSRATMRSCGVDPANAVFATNSGDSNHPLILHGATIGIDKGMTRIIDGEIYALDHDGLLRVKFLHRLPGGGIRLHSFNSTEYQDEDYDFDQVMEQRIVILGRVFWWSTIRPLRSISLV